MARRTVTVDPALDLVCTLAPLQVGRHDPTIHLTATTVLRAMRTPDGPATLRADHHDAEVDVQAWGDGASWVLEASPELLGCRDSRDGFQPDQHEVVGRIARGLPGLRLPRTGLVVEALVPSILSQRVTGFEARRSFRLLVERWGEPAPGPGGLRVLPPADLIAELPYYDLHVIGVEKERADTLKRACAGAGRLEQAGALGPDELRLRLEAIPGIGRWTSAETSRMALGDPDAVSVGDFHLKHLVSWALAQEPRGTDHRMLELLEPFVGHRGRVCRLLEASGLRAPRYGPRKRIQPTARR